MRLPTLPGRPEHKGIPQSAMNKAPRKRTNAVPFLAEVVEIHPERHTCDLKAGFAEESLRNVPVLTSAGRVGEQHYGKSSLPVVGDQVIVLPLGVEGQQFVIIGSIIPYLARSFQEDATGSGNKTHTNRVLGTEDGEYRRVFPSGSSVEVANDGTITLETPSGSSMQIQESDGSFNIESSGDINIESSGDIDIESSGDINLNGDGYSMVRFEELETAVSSFLSQYNTHYHLAPNGNTGTPEPGAATFDISDAETPRVKTG